MRKVVAVVAGTTSTGALAPLLVVYELAKGKKQGGGDEEDKEDIEPHTTALPGAGP